MLISFGMVLCKPTGACDIMQQSNVVECPLIRSRVPQEVVQVKEQISDPPGMALAKFKELFPEPSDNTYYSQMVQRSADKSARHQQKFLARKHQVVDDFNRTVRYQSDLGAYAAVILSESFAFLHVWKCGGSTVVALLGDQVSLNDTDVQDRQWVGFVRDPIDRFLSAWAECGFRQLDEAENGEYQKLEHHTVLNWISGEYDFRVRAFLYEVKDFTFPEPKLTCYTHAHPQANSMMNRQGEIDDHVAIIGDLKELPSVLEIAGFDGFQEGTNDRSAAFNKIKMDLFPARRDLLQDTTVLELCEFYALDYYLFDFDPPEICVRPGGPLATFA